MRLQFKDGTERLTWAYPSLSRQLKKCAAYILDHPSDVATLSMRQVASRAEVPPSTMHRLARTLGFDTYNEFRDIYRNGVSDFSIGYPQKAGELQANVGDGDFDHAVDTFHRGGRRQCRFAVSQHRPRRVAARHRGPGRSAQCHRGRYACILLVRQLLPLRRGHGLAKLAPGNHAKR